MKNQLKSAAFLILAALIWGLSFVAQSKGVEVIEAFTFNGIRTLLGALVLLPVIALREWGRRKKSNVVPADKSSERRLLLKGGIACGVVLCIAGNLQQYAFSHTSVGKIGFITALYMLIVPIMGLFLKKRVPLSAVAGAAIGCAGLYLLCIKGGASSIGRGELLTFASAIVFAVHIIVIDKYASLVDNVKLSCVQFFVSGTISCVCMFIFDTPRISAIVSAAPYILYAGIMSCGIAFTFQIIGQRDCDPTVASILLCLESVFAALFGWLLLHERLSARELTGCALMFAAIVLAQIPLEKLFKKGQNRSKTDAS